MTTNTLLPFSTGAGANNMNLAEYGAVEARMTGFQNGVADATIANRALRQACFAAAALGLFAADNSGIDTLDDGDVKTFADNIKKAVNNLILSGGSTSIHYGEDTSSTANTVTVTVSPVVASLADGQIFLVKIKNTSTITTPVMNVSGIGNKSIVRADGSAPFTAELVANAMQLFAYNATLDKFVLLGTTKRYVDAVVAALDFSAYLAKSGGTMTGDLVLASDPTLALHAATKQYVDGKVPTPTSIISYVVSTFAGTANALTGSAIPTAPSSLTPGSIIVGEIGTTNTGTSVTMRLNGGAIYNVLLSDGSTLPAAGKLVSGHIVLFRFDGTNIRALFDFTAGRAISAVSSGGRILAALPPGSYSAADGYNIATVGSTGSSIVVTFSVALDTSSYVVVGIPSPDNINGLGMRWLTGASAKSATGFTASFATGAADNGGGGEASYHGGLAGFLVIG